MEGDYTFITAGQHIGKSKYGLELIKKNIAMGFKHKHTPGDWIEETDGESNFHGIINNKNWLMRIQQNGEKGLIEQESNLSLISQAPALLEWAEMLHDQWACMEKPPAFLKQLKETITKAGVEITH